MPQDLHYAVREAYTMSLGYEQSIKFIMSMTKVDRDTAKHAFESYKQRVMMAH